MMRRKSEQGLPAAVAVSSHTLGQQIACHHSSLLPRGRGSKAAAAAPVGRRFWDDSSSVVGVQHRFWMKHTQE